MIELRNVSFGYEAKTEFILEDINLKISVGDFVVLKGISGSGKTTLLNILGLINLPTKGNVYISGERIEAKNIRRYRKSFYGYIFQDFKLIEEYTIMENLLSITYLNSNINEVERVEYIESYMKKMKLPVAYLTRYPQEISGGERQRVAFVRALLSGASIFIADEPTGSLDADNGNELIKQLKILNDKGMTVILSTHNQTYFKIGNRSLRIESGKVYED